MSGGFKYVLLIPHIKIHNANALSSPFTVGFPAMTAWLGAVHALQRKLNQAGIEIDFSAAGVVSHEVDLQTYQGSSDYVASIIGMANPLDKTGARSAFIEEARCHLDVSLVIEYKGLPYQQEDILKERVAHLLNASIKIAGGDIQSFKEPECFVIENDNDEDLHFAKLTRKLMPGHVLVERRELMQEAMEEGQDAMDALIDYLAIHHSFIEDDEGNITWQSKRKSNSDKPMGWIVPIVTGFHAISDLGQAKNQRDPETPHCFAESIVTLGEFKMPYRLNSIQDMLWRYHFDEPNRLYQCTQSTAQNFTIEDEFS